MGQLEHSLDIVILEDGSVFFEYDSPRQADLFRRFLDGMIDFNELENFLSLQTPTLLLGDHILCG